MQSKVKNNSNIKPQGITLISLVVTILILLILAGVGIPLTIGDNGIFSRASKATLVAEFSNYLEELQLYNGEKSLQNLQYNPETLNAGKNTLVYDTQPEDEQGSIKDVIKSIKDEYLDKFEVVNGKLVMNTTDDIESEVASNLGIQVNPFDIIDGVLQSSDKNLNLQGNNGVVVIPSSVTEIANGVFSDVEGLKEVIIPGSVKKIGANAFSYNSGIEKVTMQEGVEYIGEYAFASCSNLIEVSIPDTVTQLGGMSFYMCSKLQKVKLSDNITTIYGYTFSDCSQLTTINMPSKLEAIGTFAFNNCRSLNNITLPATLNTIGSRAFGNCKSLSNMQIDSGNTSFKIEKGIIYSYNGKDIINVNINGVSEGVLDIPEGVENITDSAFLLCSDVTTIKFPSTLERISWSTFEGMTKLETIEISKNNPNYISEDGFVYTSGYSTLIYCIAKDKTITINDKVKSLGSYAFNGLKTVEEVIIPDNVTTINIRVFQGCSNLKKISIGKGTTSINQIAFWGINNFELDISDENNYYSSDDTFLYNKDKTTIVSYLKSNLNVVVPEGVVTIGGNAFYAKYITSVKLPSTLKVIGEAAFIMNNLNEIEIPSSVESIGSSCFSQNGQLERIIVNKPKDSITGAPWGATKGDRVVIWQG